jgi:hypothetical protein
VANRAQSFVLREAAEICEVDQYVLRTWIRQHKVQATKDSTTGLWRIPIIEFPVIRGLRDGVANPQSLRENADKRRANA